MNLGFNFRNFLQSIKDEDLPVIIKKAENEAYNAESGSYGVKGAKEKREGGSINYVRQLNGLLFLLRHGAKPSGLSADEFQSLKPICKNLVEKKQFKITILEIFD